MLIKIAKLCSIVEHVFQSGACLNNLRLNISCVRTLVKWALGEDRRAFLENDGNYVVTI